MTIEGTLFAFFREQTKDGRLIRCGTDSLVPLLADYVRATLERAAVAVETTTPVYHAGDGHMIDWPGTLAAAAARVRGME